MPLARPSHTHTRGLYHKRCGIAKESPYTHWHCGPCHMHSYQGGHISDDQEYKNITDNGEKTNYKPFVHDPRYNN